MLETRIKRMTVKIERLHRERSCHFCDIDTTFYERINRRLNTSRKDLDNLLRIKQAINAYGFLPVCKERLCTYTRFETLPEDTRVHIKLWDLQGHNLYQINNGPFGRNLKDIVSFLSN